jgi:hypothetical protein
MIQESGVGAQTLRYQYQVQQQRFASSVWQQVIAHGEDLLHILHNKVETLQVCFHSCNSCDVDLRLWADPGETANICWLRTRRPHLEKSR